MEPRPLPSPPEITVDALGFFRWGNVAGKVVVTNDAGDWVLLSESAFADLLGGRVVDGHPDCAELRRKGFLRDGLDLDAFADRMARHHRHVARGPHVHVVAMSRTAEGTTLDMAPAVIEQIVDLALQSTSPTLAFEMHAPHGEPLRNFDGVRHLVDFARARNREAAGKTLSFSLASNLTAMSEPIAEWLIDNDVLLVTSLDGPATLHDWNRRWKGGSAHADVVRWLEHFAERYAERGRDARLWHVEAQPSITRPTLESWREVIDEYVTRRLPTILLRPLAPVGPARDAWATIGYSADEYLAFYRRALDYMVDLNRRGIAIAEHMASIILTKMLTGEDAGVVDLQSPSGEGSGQLAYDIDGSVFPNDEARQLDAAGDPMFRLGQIRDLSIADLLRHPTVRAIATASLLDAQPMCADCWNKPFCGYSAVRNYVTQGDLFGRRPQCFECKEHLAISTRLVEVLGSESDVEGSEILRRWTVNRPRLAADGRASRQAP